MAKVPRQRSETYFLNLQEAGLAQLSTKRGDRSHKSAVAKKLPPTKVSIGVAPLQDLFVLIQNPWDMSAVIDKRENPETEKYEYLVTFTGLSSIAARWLSITDLVKSRKKSLVEEYEKKKAKAVKGKTHIAAFYNMEDQVVVQWHEHPFFIVSYGGGQVNHFCVVGVNKDKTTLKCKHAKHSKQPTHQAHVALVTKHMEKAGLVLAEGTIKLAINVANSQPQQVSAAIYITSCSW